MTFSVIAGIGGNGFSGDGGAATTAAFDGPLGVGIATNTDIFIADTHNHRIRRIDGATGIISTIAGNGTPGFFGEGVPAIQSTTDFPASLKLDHAGNLNFADRYKHVIRRLSLDSTPPVITGIPSNCSV